MDFRKIFQVSTEPIVLQNKPTNFSKILWLGNKNKSEVDQENTNERIHKLKHLIHRMNSKWYVLVSFSFWVHFAMALLCLCHDFAAEAIKNYFIYFLRTFPTDPEIPTDPPKLGFTRGH